MLEIADRVHSDHIGDLPGLFSERLNGIDDTWTENLLGIGFNVEQNVIVFGVGVLKMLEGHQFGILRGEKHSVVSGKAEPRQATRRQRHDDQRQRNGEPGSADGKVRKLKCDAVCEGVLNRCSHGSCPLSCLISNPEWSFCVGQKKCL